MYIKTISEFITDTENIGGLVSLLAQDMPSSRSSEESSWKNSLPILASVLRTLPDSIKNNARIVLEAGYHSDERADAVIVGTKNTHPVIIIIENKQWSDVKNYRPISELCLSDPYYDRLPGHDKPYLEHPCHQVAHYNYTLANTNGFIQKNTASIYTAVFMHNATKEELASQEGPFSNIYQQIINKNPVFINKEGSISSCGYSLSKYIENIVDSGELDLAESIYTSTASYSDTYRTILGNVFGNREALLQLLDEEQASIFEEIRQCVNAKLSTKSVYIIEGDPGTGKTFVAEALLSYLYSSPDQNTDYVTKLLLKNRDPRWALTRLGVPKDAITYSLKDDTNTYDCLICDESHRMPQEVYGKKDSRDNLKTIIGQSTVSVFFYDEKQRVHVNDFITPEKITDAAKDWQPQGLQLIRKRLKYQHRCPTSGHFMQLMDRILYNPENNLNGIAPFTEEEDYKVRLINTPRELFYTIEKANAHRNGAHGSRVLAGKGRTNGTDWTWENDEIPLDRKRTIGPFRNDSSMYVWNRHNYCYPDSYASDDSSVNLVGCLDTSQGLDFKYVGLIFSPDIKYNTLTSRVEIDLEGHQHSDPNLTNYLSFSDARTKYGDDVLKQLIKNTYWVLASRGENGCFIYCCDENLQKYLSTIIPTPKFSVPESFSIYPDAAVGRVTGTITNVYPKGTAQIMDDNNRTYGVSVANYRSAGSPPAGSRVRFNVGISQNRYFANNIEVLTDN